MYYNIILKIIYLFKFIDILLFILDIKVLFFSETGSFTCKMQVHNKISVKQKSLIHSYTQNSDLLIT